LGRGHIVEDGALASTIGARDRDERGVACQLLEVEPQLVPAKAVSNAAEALESEHERSHGEP